MSIKMILYLINFLILGVFSEKVFQIDAEGIKTELISNVQTSVLLAHDSAWGSIEFVDFQKLNSIIEKDYSEVKEFYSKKGLSLAYFSGPKVSLNIESQNPAYFYINDKQFPSSDDLLSSNEPRIASSVSQTPYEISFKLLKSLSNPTNSGKTSEFDESALKNQNCKCPDGAEVLSFACLCENSLVSSTEYNSTNTTNPEVYITILNDHEFNETDIIITIDIKGIKGIEIVTNLTVNNNSIEINITITAEQALDVDVFVNESLDVNKTIRIRVNGIDYSNSFNVISGQEYQSAGDSNNVYFYSLVALFSCLFV